MKLKNSLIICLFALIFILTLNTRVHAASATISASAKEVTVGTKVTITTTIKGASWQINLSGAVSATYSDSTSDAEDTTTTEKTTFTPTKAGTYTVNLSGNVTGSDDTRATAVSGSVTITAKDKQTDGGSETATTVSTDATLKNLGIRPHDFSGFRKNITTYDVSVPRDTEKVTIYAVPTNSKATVAGTGEKALQIGKNTVNIKVIAEDKKTTKTYTLNITRKEVSNNANLSNLGIRPKQYDFTGFKQTTTTYNVSVPNKAEKITIYAYGVDEKTTISGIGEKTLKVGENKFEIKTTAEDKKTTKTYTLNITRKETDDEEDEEDESVPATTVTGVLDIKVGDYELTPKFKPETYEYKVDIPEDLEKVAVDVKTEKGIETEIVGNEDLKPGENLITILIRDTKTDATTIYQITANVNGEEGSETDSDDEAIDISELNNDIGEVQKNLQIRDWIIRGAIIAIVLLIIIYLIQRYRNSDDESFEEEEYGNEYEDEADKESKDFYEHLRQKYLDGISENNSSENNSEDGFEEPRKKDKYKGKRFK